jgi:hypothetical protein
MVASLVEPPKAQDPRFLPAVAEAVAEWFPELQGRALAVSEVSVTKENVPSLPLALVAFVRSTAEPPRRSYAESFEVADAFIIEFWLEPARYRKSNGSETPFWSYYPYEEIRDTLLNNLVRWPTPGGEHIAYRGLNIEAEPLAVTLTFAFVATFNWCAKIPDRGDPFKIGFKLCTPASCLPDPECFDDKPADECAPCP